MADIETEVTLDQVTDAIVTYLTTALGDQVQTVAAYAEEDVDEEKVERRTKIATPAVLIELDSFEPGDDPGTDQTALRCRWVARVLVNGLDQTPARGARSLAVAVAHAIRLQTWELPVEGAQLVGGFPDDFRPDLPDYEVWRVEWEQTIHIGTSVWSPDPDAVLVEEVYVGIAPNIGEGHEDDYVLLEEEPEP